MWFKFFLFYPRITPIDANGIFNEFLCVLLCLMWFKFYSTLGTLGILGTFKSIVVHFSRLTDPPAPLNGD